jgi:hypothetical protein
VEAFKDSAREADTLQVTEFRPTDMGRAEKQTPKRGRMDSTAGYRRMRMRLSSEADGSPAAALMRAATHSHLRTIQIWLVALAAACLFLVVSAQSAKAIVSAGAVVTYSSYLPGAHADVEQVMTFSQSGNDDAQRLVIDMPGGLIGDPNAIAVENRCGSGAGGAGGTPLNYPDLNATGQPTFATAKGLYANCAASSKVGVVSAFARITGTSMGGLANCTDADLSGAGSGLYLLKKKSTPPVPATGRPEVPTFLGIRLLGTAHCTIPWFFNLPIDIDVDMDLTAKITVRADDQGLRIQVVDDLPREQKGVQGPLGPVDATIDMVSMSQTINGMAPAPSTKPFMTNPTRCGEWKTAVSTRAYDSNANANVDLLPNSVTYPGVAPNANDYNRAVTTNTAACGNIAPFAPSFKFAQTTTRAGAPVGLKATMENPVSTNNQRQPSYPRQVQMKLPVGFKINAAVAERLGAHGCTLDEFRRPQAPTSTFQVSDLPPLCTPNTEVGTVAVTVPELQDELFGKVYLGEPLTAAQKVGSTEPDADKDDVKAGIYRLYVYATRPQYPGGPAALGVKFEGQAIVDKDTGQVSITIRNIANYNDKALDPNWPILPGLPQFNYSKFVMDFNTNSLGAGADYNPVQNPNDQQQMLTNPQVCGDYPMDVIVTPWSYTGLPASGPAGAGEPIKTLNIPGKAANNGLEVTGNGNYPSNPDNPGTPGVNEANCDFQPFNPTFDVKLTEDYNPDAAPGTPKVPPSQLPSLDMAATVNGVGMHPTMTFSIYRQDRQDNLKHLKFIMPEGFGGSLKAAVDINGDPVACSVVDVNAGTCLANAPKSKVGTVRVQTGSGALPITIKGDIFIMEKVGAEIQKYTTKLAIITPAKVGPFDLGLVVNKLYMRLTASNKFQLVSETDDEGLLESIMGVPVLYRGIVLKLDGINKQGTPTTTDDRPFLILPSKCGVSLNFQGIISSAGNHAGYDANAIYNPVTNPDPGHGSVETVTPVSGPAPPNDHTTGCTSPNFNQLFKPTVTVSGIATTPATPTGMKVKVAVPQIETGVTETTIQQSTINRVRIQFPPGLEMNPAVAENLESCPTTEIDADIANPNADSNRCESNHPKSKLGNVHVNTPLLPDLPGKQWGVEGAMYLEQQGPIKENRMRFVLYLNMPGGQQIVRGGAVVAGSTDGPTAGLGSTTETPAPGSIDTSVIDGTPLQGGQLESDFNGLPDVSYSWMELDFAGSEDPDDQHIVPMFVSPDPATCPQVNTTKVRVNATNVGAKNTPPTSQPDWYFNTPGDPTLSFTTDQEPGPNPAHPCRPAQNFAPTADIQVTADNPPPPNASRTPDPTLANVHPDMKATILRNDMEKDLEKTIFHLPAGMTGAPAATPKCSLASAAAATCATTAPASVVGAVEVELGSGADTIVIDNGKIYNTQPANADEPARLTTNATVALGPFDLGSMSIPIETSLRQGDLGLDSTVMLPQRFEGIRTHYRRLSMILKGYADMGTPADLSDDKPFLTNPSKCQVNTFTLDAWPRGAAPNDPPAQAQNTYTTHGCPMDFPFGTQPTLDLTPTSTDSESPTGLNITMTNGTAASYNSTIKAIRIAFPHGMTVNPGVGNDGANAVCSTAKIDAGGDAPLPIGPCPAASERGSVSIKTPLLVGPGPGGSFPGKLYLEEPGNTKETRFRLAMVVKLPGTKLVIRGSNLINGASDLNGPTGAVDSGTGIITAEFNQLPDLPFYEMQMSLYDTDIGQGRRALLVNPPTCGNAVMKGEILPNTGTPDDERIVQTYSSYNVTGCQPTPPTPTFDASLSAPASHPLENPNKSAGHPDFNLTVGNLGKSPQISEFDLDLPSGFVADTVATERCSKIDLAAVNCSSKSIVGSVTTTMGSAGDMLTLQGNLHNVALDPLDPVESKQPARLQVILPVLVGPYDLGKLSIPVETSMRKDYGIHTHTELPYRYEGIDVYVRAMTISVGGYSDQGNPPAHDYKPFMINPTECGNHTVTATIVRRSGPPVAPISKQITIDPGTCPRNFVDVGYPNGIGLKVTPQGGVTETGVPVKLAFEVTNSIDNPTLKQIAMEMPDGMELNPAVANGLTTCSSEEIDNNGGAGCVNTSANVGTVVLNTPLLPLPQTGNVFLEDPIGNDKDTRYRVALVAHLPGKEMISRGTVSIDGSSTIPTGGTGNVGGGTGKMTTVFYGETSGTDLPDLAFSKMTVNFDGGFSGRPMFTNPRSCGLAEFKADVTPHGGAAPIEVSDNYTTTSDCGAPGFDPTFSGSAVPTTSAANPLLTLTATTPRKQNNIKTFDIDLPTGLVASTGNVPLCSKTQSDQGNCDLTSAVGDVDAWIGTSDTLTDDYKISGKVYNVAPLPGEPARLAVGMDVQVGPFDLGKLPIPVTAELRPDWGVTTHTSLPSRYEGIAVNMRKMEIRLASSVGGKPFAINPSKCQANTTIAKMVSDGLPPQTQTNPSKDRWSYNTTGCAPFNPATKPTIDVTPSTTQAGAPVGLRIDINSTEGNPTLKRTEVTFPEGLEINPAFAKNMTACQTADVDLSIANDPLATYCAAATKIADITMTTPLMSSKPQGRMYLEQPDPSGDADTRYRTVMILDLPGRKLVLRGQVSIDGSTDIAPGATGTADYDNNSTGQLTAIFDNIPDLGFTQLRLDFNAGSKAMTVNPTDCNQSYTFTGVFTPHSSATTATSTSTPANWPSGCNASFAPQFTAQVDTNPANTPAAGHPDLTLQVKNGANQHELHKLTIELPVGLVANTTATGTRCSQDDARDANCAAGESVGDFSTIIGSTDGTPGNPVADRVELTGGKIYNVVPNSDEPARMQAVMAVAVGPFDLGMLSIPVTTKLNSDMSVDAVTVLPKRYEGIAVKVRQMDMKLNGVVGGENFMLNPSRCATHTISGEMESVDGDTRTTSSTFTTTGCAPLAAAYDPTVSFTTDPHDAGAPTAMDMNVQLPADSSTTSNVKITFPQGFELSPAAADGLATCSAEQVDAGGHAAPPIGPCPAASQLATISLTTPLLSGVQQGELYIEPSIGRWASTRFRLAMVIHLPGQNLIIRGGTLVNGASDLIDDKGAKNSGNGVVTAEFPGLPDLGFDDMSVNFDPTRKLFVNPKTCGNFDVTAELTPHAGSSPVEPSPKPQITTSGGTCGQNTFNPGFTGSLTPAESGANPDLTMQITNPDGMQEVKKLDLHLPVGLVARTTGVPQCEPGNAEIGNCPNSIVGNVTTTIGSFGETLTIGGDIVNIVPEADQPARMFAVVPVLVGPFDLGKLTVDVPTKLNDDLSVTASTELPTRYEGISVRVRQLDMTVLGEPYPNQYFMVAPTKCGTSAVGAHITSDTGTEIDRSFNFTIPQPTCDNRTWAAEPQMAVSASPAVRNTPSNLTFDLTSDPDNPTISKMHVELPDNVEINPAFGASVATCGPSDIDAGGAACDPASKIAVVTMRTHLLDPNKDYVGEAYLEPQGPTAATRFKIAIVVHMPGDVNIVVRGSVSVAGATDIDPTSGTGSTAEVPAGKIIADFDNIPDLGFSSLKVAFNTTRPMLINAPVDGPQTLAVGITPHSSATATTLSPAPSYTTTGGNTPATFNPTFTAGIDNPAPAAHPNLTLTVDRTNNNARSIAGFDLDLPVGLVASTTATNVKCTETEAADANCPAASKVGSFSTRIGNGNTVAEDLALSGGEIFNVVPREDINNDLTEPARLAATIQVAVGPFHLGRLAIPIETALREDAGVSTTTVMPTRYEGIAVRIKQMQIVLNGTVGGNPFMQNPSKCQDHPVRARITSAGPSPETVTKQSIITTSGCGAGFGTAPGVNVSVNPDATSEPTALGVQITSAANNPTIGRMELALPVGMSINAAAGNGLVTCSPDPNDLPYFGCGNNQTEFDDAVQGTVSVHTPLLGDTFTGYLFLEDPLGNDKDTRYRMAIVLELPGQAIVVHGRVQIDGSSTITPSDQTGSVDEGTGQVTTIFDAIPDLSFDDFQINMKTGPRALLTNPDTCGTQTVTTKITSNAGGPDATPSPTFDLTTGDDCGAGQGFDPTFAIDDGPLPGGLHTSGANEDLVMTVTAGGTDQQLRDFTMHLPVGLVADTTATKPNTCSQADAVAAICGTGSIVGTIETKLGSGSETLDIATGEIHNVIPSHDEPARMAAIVPVDVGPYNLGRLAIPVETTLRPDPDYGVDAHTVVPLKYEGIRVRIQEMKMTMLGTVGAPPNDKGFMKNPSRCDAGTDAVTADFLSATSTPVTKTADYPVGGCPVDFVSPPTLAVSGVNTQIEQPTGMTLEVGTDPDNPSIKRVKTTMPEGMTINPAVGNKVNYCPAANLVLDTCPAASVIGEVEAQSPLIDGVHDGKVVLEQPGNTAADRYKLAMIIDVPGQKVIVHGTTAVDGSTDLVDGLGSTAEVGVTGRIVTDFPDLPDLNFSHIRITFDNGPEALLANSSMCEQDQKVSAEFESHAGTTETGESTGYDLSFDGNGAPCPEDIPQPRSFDPQFTGSVSTTQAAGNPDLTLSVTRQDKTQQLKQFNLHLPPGLVADSVSTPRCAQNGGPGNSASKGDCPANTIVGDVTTEIGTGGKLLKMTGSVHNVEPTDPEEEPARFAAIFNVEVGPYNLGRLSIPVTAKIVTGLSPSDLSIDTFTRVPQRYEGVPVRMRSMEIKLLGVVGTPPNDKPFMINPSKCGQHTVSAKMWPDTADPDVDPPGKTGSFDFTTTGCPAAFNPSIETTVSPTQRAGEPADFNLAINVPGNSSSIQAVTTRLPEGFEINPGIANRGGPNALAGCPTADIDAGNLAGCSDAKVGDVTLDTPLLSTQRTGAIYLEQDNPLPTPATRYKLAIVISLPGPDLVVHGDATIDGTGQGVGAGTGRISATFENLPDLQFSRLDVDFDTGPNGMLIAPKTCGGSFESSADLAPWSVAEYQTPASAKVTRTDTVAVSDGCAQTFNPSSFTAEVSDPNNVGQFIDHADQASNTDLRMKLTAGATDERLAKMTIGLPVGLVASPANVATCTATEVNNDTCASEVGDIATSVGSADPLALTGKIYNVEPLADEPARMAAAFNVKVGPYDLGRLVIPVATKMRAGNDADPQRRYGIDAITDVPTRFEGVGIQMRTIEMTIDGTVGGQPFMINPSKCGPHTVTADLESENGTKVSRSGPASTITIDNCANAFKDADPQITAAVDPENTAMPTNFSLGLTSSAANQTIESISTTLPDGMTINPGFAATAAVCDEADVDAGDFSGCAGAQVGRVALVTPLLVGPGPGGSFLGKVYLVESGNGAAERYRMAIAVDLPGQTLVVRGSVWINGSTELVDGLGSTSDTGQPSDDGQLTASFDAIPDLGFTSMDVDFDTGPRALMTNPELCNLSNTVAATVMPTSGSTAATPSATFETSYDGQGQGCPAAIDEAFAPTFSAVFSGPDATDADTVRASGNPDLTLTVTRPDKTQQLGSFDLELPPGLVANTVDTDRCLRSLADIAQCPTESRVGDVSTKVGTGVEAELLDLSGSIYNVETSGDDEPARLAVGVDVVVGPYDLGRLSVPVTAEIIGDSAEELRVLTHAKIPTRYEGIPVRLREMKIELMGRTDAANKPFMISPSRCDITHTIKAHMTSTLATDYPGDPRTEHDGTADFTTDGCSTSPYTPSLTASLLPDGTAGKPVGLKLGFNFTGTSSSSKKIVTKLPEGMGINPGIGNLGNNPGNPMTCDTAVLDAKPIPVGGPACSTNSVIGSVELDTPLLPTPPSRTGKVYLETPDASGDADKRYRIAVWVDLPGDGDLVVHGSAQVKGSSDITPGDPGATGAVDKGSGQVTATFDNLPDLQFSRLEVTFNTTGGGKHALLTNPETCPASGFDIRATMTPWSRPTTSVNRSATVFSTGCNTPPQPLSLTANTSSLGVGEHADLDMTLTRPDGNRSIKSTKFELPKGLVGSADATEVTCADDAANAQAGVCPANSKVGEVAIDIGSSDDPYTVDTAQIGGGIYNVTAPADRPAKLVFAVRVEVGPFDLGNVVVPIDVNIDPNEYFLWAQTGDLPQVYEGIPVRISQMRMKLYGEVANSDPKYQPSGMAPFMSNPRSCDSALDIKAQVNFTSGAPDEVTGTVGPFTGCGSLSLAQNTIEVSNDFAAQPNNLKPEAPTQLRVKVTQGELPTQAGMRDLALSLPGFRLNAPAADNAASCSDAQLDAESCPAASQIGTTWLDTPLLPKNVVNPDDPGDPIKHSLWGKVYLITPGNTSTDRYRMAIQMTGKTLITIRGTAIVDETKGSPTEGEMITQFEDLPDIPFTSMEVMLTGIDDGGIKPLLLNPENSDTGNDRTVTATAAMTAWSGQTAAPTSDVSVDPGSVKGFSPTFDRTISDYQSGGHPDADFSYTRADGDLDISSVKMSLPAGFLGSAAAVPLCALAAADAGTCSDASKVGTVSVTVGQFGQTMTLPGSVYLTAGEGSDIAGMAIKVDAKAGANDQYDLGAFTTRGRIIVRPGDHGIDANFDNVPRMFKGVPTHIVSMSVHMNGRVNNGQTPFLFNSSSCAAQEIKTTLTPYGGAPTTLSKSYQATGCASRTFSPHLTFTAHGGGVGNPPAWTITMGSNYGDSTLASTTVTLPSAITINVAGIALACTPEDAAARACKESAKIGTVSITTPLLTYPVTGTVYMAKSISGQSLPDLMIDIPAPIDMQIRGANRFVGANYNMIESTFSGLPDMIFSQMTMEIAGGPSGLIMLRSNGVCGAANAVFGSHAGQQVTQATTIIGIEGFCAERAKACVTPKIKVSTKGVKVKKNKKSKVSVSLAANDNCSGLRSVRVTFPKGSKFNKKAVKKGLSGKAGTKSLKSKDFSTADFSGRAIKPKSDFTGDTRSFSMATKNSALVLPYKTFCGGLKGKKLKKCKKKTVTFIFDVTNMDGTSYRYQYKVPAGSKSFK